MLAQAKPVSISVHAAASHPQLARFFFALQTYSFTASPFLQLHYIYYIDN